MSFRDWTTQFRRTKLENDVVAVNRYGLWGPPRLGTDASRASPARHRQTVTTRSTFDSPPGSPNVVVRVYPFKRGEPCREPERR